MKIGFVSLGCPKNLVDSEVMLGLAEQAGHEITTDADGADVLVVNTCAFIDRAKQESIDTILEMAELKKQVAGPAAGRHRVSGRAVSRGAAAGDSRRSMRCSAPAKCRGFSRRLTGTAAGRRLSTVDGSHAAIKPLTFHRERRASASTCPTYLYDADTPRRLATPGHYAYVKIAEGCDYKCAFCIIPKMRGHYRSRTDRVDRRRSARAGRRAASRSCC